MRFHAKIKVKHNKLDSGQFATRQAAMNWARDREANHLTITETTDKDVKRVIFSGRPS